MFKTVLTDLLNAEFYTRRKINHTVYQASRFGKNVLPFKPIDLEIRAAFLKYIINKELKNNTDHADYYNRLLEKLEDSNEATLDTIESACTSNIFRSIGTNNDFKYNCGDEKMKSEDFLSLICKYLKKRIILYVQMNLYRGRYIHHCEFKNEHTNAPEMFKTSLYYWDTLNKLNGAFLKCLGDGPHFRSTWIALDIQLRCVLNYIDEWESKKNRIKYN